MWRILASTNSHINLNPGYYDCLTRLSDPGVLEFETIILLDVKRTGEATVSDEFFQKLNRILTAYARYLTGLRRRNVRVGYCQGLHMIVAYFLVRGLSEEVGSV